MFLFELIASSVTSLLFLFFLITSLKLQETGNPWVSPGVFPAILSSIVLTASIVWCADTAVQYRRWRKAEGEEEYTKAKGGLLHLSEEGKRLGVIVILTVLYIMVLMPFLGFVFATLIFLFVSIMLFYGKWRTALIVSISMSAAMFLLFRFVLHLPMPR